MDNRSLEIVSRFENSWKKTEYTLESLCENGFERLLPVRNFIVELKQKGENQHFRIGTSLYRLIFSRSVDHGLRDDQKHIVIDTVNNYEYIITFKDGLKAFRRYKINDLHDPKLTRLLATLKRTLVD